jgi:hypothetical protein
VDRRRRRRDHIVANHDGDRTATIAELDRQLEAVIDDAKRAGLADTELTPLRDAARQRQE